MNHPRAPMGKRWALRSAGLLTAALALVGLPTPAGATIPPSGDGEAGAAATAAAAGAAAPGPATLAVAVGPAAQTVQEGTTATFTASITSRSPVTIRWQSATTPTGPWTDLDTPTGPRFTPTATTSMDGHLFRATATSGQQAASSPPALLHVHPADTPPRTTAPPSPASACPSPAPTPATEPGAPCPGPTPPATPPPAPTAAPSVTTTPSAGPAPANPTTTATGQHYGTVGTPVIELGQEQTVTGHNFTPGTLVKVSLEPAGIDLGTHTAGPDGTVTTRFATTLLTPGTHTVRWTPLPP